jgi:hypothetical protein
MNLNENINRIKQVMGIITENKPVDKLIDKMGVKGAIQFAGGIKSFNSIGGIDYLFDKVDELLKDYTNLIIVDDMEDKGGGDKGTWKSVAYGEKNNEKPTEPPYVYFNWSKNPMNNPKASLEFDKVLSEKLTSLNIPENVTKIILEKWVRKYYDNIPPISTVRFGDTLGYNQGFSKPDPNSKPNNNKIYIPKYEDYKESISKEEIIKLLKDLAEKTPKEKFIRGTDNLENFLEWSHTIFKQVEDKFDRENMDREDLRKDYDYVLMNIWGDAIDDDGLIPYRELMPNIKDIVRNSDREERERLNR